MSSFFIRIQVLLVMFVIAADSARGGDRSVNLTMERGQASGLLMQMKMDEAFEILTRHWREAEDAYEKGDAEIWLGYAYFYMGDYRTAARYYRDGITKVDEAGYKRRNATWAANYPFALYLVDRGQQKLAYCYWKLGKLNAAAKTLNDALETLNPLLESAHDAYKKSAVISSATRVLETLGQVQSQLGDPVRAQETYRRIVKLCDETLAAGGLLVGNRASTLMLRSRAKLEAGDLEGALQDADASISENERSLGEYTGTTQSEVFDHHHRSQVLRALGRLKEALASAERALEISEDRRVPGSHPQSYALLKTWLVPSAAYQVGEVYRELGMLEPAEAAYRRSIEASEEIYATMNSLAVRQSFSGRQGLFEEREPAYERLAGLLAAKNQWEEAFVVAEKGRSRALLDCLGNAPPRETGPWAVDPALLERDQEFANRLAELIRTLHMASGNPNIDVKAVAAELRQTQNDYATFRNTLALQHPGYAVFQTIQTVDTKDLAELFASDGPLDGAAMISYVQTDALLLGFCFDGKRLHAEVLSRDVADVAANVQLLRERIEARAPNWMEPAKELHGLLVAPFAVHVADKQKLLIAPHGSLHFLPFAALSDEQGRPLIERYELGHLPSASMLRVWAERDRREENDGRVATRALAVANPDGTLPFAEDEGALVQSVFDRADVLIGSEAQEGRYLLLAPDADVIHVATHGVLNRLQPGYSHLVLAEPPEDDTAVDGLLDVHEIVRKLDAGRARLVVLSACQTGIGDTSGGDEVQSLANAFLYAGAREVVSSLWSVDDRKTAEWMKRFYAAQENHKQPLAALREAMLAAIASDEHPYYWAGFQIVGER